MSTRYDPAFATMVADFTHLGATNKVLGEAFDVHPDTISAWRKRYSEFDEAVRRARFIADNDAARGWYSRAVGMVIEVDRAFKVKDADGNERVEVVTMRTEIPPDVAAAKSWLAMRRPDEFSEKALENTAAEDVLAAMAAILDRVNNTSRGLPADDGSTNPPLIERCAGSASRPGVTIDATPARPAGPPAHGDIART